MIDRIKLRLATTSRLPLEVVDVGLLNKLKEQKHVYVPPRQLRSSNHLLTSGDFSRCQGIGFFEDTFTIGALAHQYPAQDPYYTLIGEWSNTEKGLEDPRKIFPDRGRVSVVHAYDEGNYEWPERWIESALKKIGITKVFHIPIRPFRPGHHQWRYMAQDVRQGKFYVFPTDFPYGICFDVKNYLKMQDQKPGLARVA